MQLLGLKGQKHFFLTYPNKYRSDLSKKIVFDPIGQRASKIEALKVSSDRESNPDRPKTTFSLLERFKRGNAPTSFFSFFFEPELSGTTVLQPLDIQGHIVPHLKDLTRVYLELEAQGPFRTFKVLYLASK